MHVGAQYRVEEVRGWLLLLLLVVLFGTGTACVRGKGVGGLRSGRAKGLNKRVVVVGKGGEKIEGKGRVGEIC